MKSIPFFVAVLAVLSVTGCKPKTAAAPGAPPPAPAVTVARVEQRELTEFDELTGRVEAVESVEVRPRVSGHILEVRFQSGQWVKKGDVLFVIDPRWQKAEFERTSAEVLRAKAKLATTEREALRAKELLTDKAISVEESEQRNSKFSEARAALAATQAALDTAKLDLEFTEIRAPIDGRVSRAWVTAGNYVSGGPGMNSVLTTVVSVNPIYVYADMDEATLLKFQRLHPKLANADGRVPVRMALTDEEGFPHEGTIESFDNRLDPATGSILLRTVFPNPDGRLLPGLFARVRVPGSERKPTLLISDRAIGTDQSQKFVLILSATNTVEYRPVKIGPLVEGKRVIRSGLNSGEQVVVNGLQRVRPGMPVVPETEVAVVGGNATHGNAAPR
jgi:RND family efflux transporter MFP subunit